MRTRTRFTGLGLALVLALAGCASGGDEAATTDAGDAAEPRPQATEDAGEAEQDTAGDDAATGDAGIISVAAPLGRKVVFSASLSLEVADTAATVEDIRRVVEAADGFVASAELHRTGPDDLLAGTMTLRVPAGDLPATLTRLKAMADRVVDESIDSDDVTEEYADVEAQLRNLRALETELLSLLGEVRERSDDAEQILTVFQRVRDVRSEIERLEGRRQVLDDLVALSTVRVSLAPTPSSAPIASADEWRPGEVARGALRATVGALRVVADAVIWIGLTAVPVVVVVVGLPLAAAVAVRHAWRRRSEQQMTR